MKADETPDFCDAFIEKFAVPLTQYSDDRLLAGLRVAVKDNFDIAGTVTGAGNPEWAASHEIAGSTADVVLALLAQGAEIVGKTHMDELAYSLMGQNARYGTPLNPAAPTRMPGGSSSGSASAVAAKLADIGVGSDTGGSVRLPAAFCGLFGWRPTHGLISPKGMLGLAPSFDVPGFFTRDIDVLKQLSAVFGVERSIAQSSPELRLPSDMWDLTLQSTQSALKACLPSGNDADLLDVEFRKDLFQTFRICQGWETAELFGPWIRQNDPAFGVGIRERFASAMQLTEADFAVANARRAQITEVLETVIPLGTIVIYPTTPGPAPLLTVSPLDLEQYRNSALTLLSVAGLAGLPQVTLPLAAVDDAPIGLSLISARGSDADLIEIASRIIPLQ